ncbi:MAG: helix-turn-helix domain-containing protein [Bacteroidales bacterium]|nr:helix-turn-helix domain-containing protein [Bacteroidales bacterium]
MKTFTQTLDRMQRIHALAVLEHTGTPTELAHKIGISEAHLYNIIRLMRELGAPINFSKQGNSYFYAQDVHMLPKLFCEKLTFS